MTTQQPEALRLADLLAYESSPDSVYWKCAAELRRLHAECEALSSRCDRLDADLDDCRDKRDALHAECEELRKSLALVQQHHATAWNRGHTMGMHANAHIARQAQEAVARDAWGNTQLTEALMAAEAECEALRADAERYRWLRENAADYRLTQKDGYGGRELRGWEELDAAIDAARAAKEQV